MQIRFRILPTDWHTQKLVPASDRNMRVTRFHRLGIGGQEDDCACGIGYPAGTHPPHLGRQVSLLVREYFDDGLGQDTIVP